MSPPRPRRPRTSLLIACAAALLAAGCGSPRSITLSCKLEAPVLITPPLAIDGTLLAEDPIGQEYLKDVSFGDPTPASFRQEDGPPYQQTIELGATNVFEQNCVANGAIYVGRYEGLMVIIPVNDTWAGYYGDVIHVKPAAGAPGAAAAAAQELGQEEDQ